MHRALTFRGVGLFRRYGAGQTPSQELLELAEDDAWGWCYDPTNPAYRTLGTDPAVGDVEVVRQVRDGLETYEPIGKGTDGSPEDASLSPYYHKAAIGSWDGMEFHDRDSNARRLKLPPLAAPISQPYFIMALVKAPSGGSITRNIFDKQESLIVRRAGTSDEYEASVDLPTTSSRLVFNEDRGRDAQTVLLGVLVNGTNSKTWVNGVEDATGNIFGTSALDGFTLGASEDGQSFHWDGRIGPVVLREGEPADAVRKRMENLLLKYSDAEVYEIPEALDLDGLALYLDGSEGQSLRTLSGEAAADGSIYRWADKSINRRHAIQATSGAQPIRKTGIQNGNDIVRFDGTNDEMEINYLAGLINNTAGITVFAVRKITSSASTNQLIQISNGNTATSVRFASLALTDGEMRITARRLDADSTPPLDTSGNPHGAGFEIQSSLIDWSNQIARIKLDGVTVAEDLSYGDGGANWDNIDPLAAKIGTNLAEAVFLDGDYATLVVYDRPLTSQEETDVLEFLQNKWATPALP